jgi:nitrite reductase/ring-hydroxylating ferredoxin subunit
MNAISPLAGPTYHRDLIQGTPEWLQARCGLLTASELKLIVAPPPEPETRIKKNGEPYKQREWNPVASNDKERAHLFELLAQRINQRVEEGFQGYDMLRGHAEEAEARYVYERYYAPVEVCGFITNNKWGFTLGYSPDGLVGENGLIECKSRKAKFQVETIIAQKVPDEHVIQCQAALLISEREWLDFVSYSNGMCMATITVEPDPIVQEAIIEAATAFEARLAAKLDEYRNRIASGARLIPTIYSPPLGDIQL